MTLNCVTPTKLSVIQIINHNVCLKYFLFIYQNGCLLVALCIHISLIFQKVVWRHIYGVVGYIITTSLQIVRRMCQRKNFENQPIIGEDMDKSTVPNFLWTALYINVSCVNLR